jgi:hypothetical protein
LIGDHEMEERSVMPHQVAPRWSPRSYVPDEPRHPFGGTVRSECPRASKAAVNGELPPPTSITLSDGSIPTRSSICNDQTAWSWNQLRVASPCPYT